MNILAVADALSHRDCSTHLAVLARRGARRAAELVAHLAALDYPPGAVCRTTATGRSSVLHRGPAPVRGCCLQPHRSGQSVPAIPDPSRPSLVRPRSRSRPCGSSARTSRLRITRPSSTRPRMGTRRRSKPWSRSWPRDPTSRPPCGSCPRRRPRSAVPARLTLATIAAPSAPTTGSQPPPRGVRVRAARPVVQATAPERYRVQFTIGEETHVRLRHVQALLRREIPDGDPAAIFDRALQSARAQRSRRRSWGRRQASADAHLSVPGRIRRLDRSALPSRHVPREVKRGVWRRDEASAPSCHRTAGGARSGRSWIAVGTPVARRPPHRSERAQLTHSALASGSEAEAVTGMRVRDAGRRQVGRDKASACAPRSLESCGYVSAECATRAKRRESGRSREPGSWWALRSS